jgi:hypothetical protein
MGSLRARYQRNLGGKRVSRCEEVVEKEEEEEKDDEMKEGCLEGFGRLWRAFDKQNY